jgi:hypothetical protein
MCAPNELDGRHIMARDYKREYAIFHGKPEQIKRRAQRNKSRRALARAGRVSKGDGMDVHHKNNNVYDQGSHNISVVSKSKNRSMK